MNFKPGDIVVYDNGWVEVYLVLEADSEDGTYKLFVLFDSNKYWIGKKHEGWIINKKSYTLLQDKVLSEQK